MSVTESTALAGTWAASIVASTASPSRAVHPGVDGGVELSARASRPAFTGEAGVIGQIRAADGVHQALEDGVAVATDDDVATVAGGVGVGRGDARHHVASALAHEPATSNSGTMLSIIAKPLRKAPHPPPARRRHSLRWRSAIKRADGGPQGGNQSPMEMPVRTGGRSENR